ncbi:hypothetical protein [Nocardia sp. NRRL S-836]|uniref:hypothetical protein n=1 Tax=Nocardia sp. NRRL S-836 TaxID=1519492 RepID=UPI0006C1CF10|nr:hypothetical protein [Nocardia sp. NRRL S-836]KOV78517.1 hypothetical protein ADL03_39770 [Nocardia sp. NRRL S-836]
MDPERGRPLQIPLAVGLPEATAAAVALRAVLPPDVTAIGGHRRLTVLRLLSDTELDQLRPAVESLIASFRGMARVLVAALAQGAVGAEWLVHEHGEHCRFENAVSGVVVEACVDRPEELDPYFLLEFARTDAAHRVVAEACVEGFHDMCRVLNVFG